MWTEKWLTIEVTCNVIMEKLSKTFKVWLFIGRMEVFEVSQTLSKIYELSSPLVRKVDTFKFKTSQ